MKILIYIGYLSISFHALAGTLSNNTYVYDCDRMRTSRIQKYETELHATERIDYDLDYNPPLIAQGVFKNELVRVNYEELILDKEIKCFYKISHEIIRPDRPDKISVQGKFFSHICLDLKGDINYISRRDLTFAKDFAPTAIDAGDGKRKIIENQRTSLGYLWQKGECNPDSLNYFQQVKDVTQKVKLIENKFVLLKEDKDYILFYANPGLVIKTKKQIFCFNDDKCDLKIVYKKQLKAAIYDADGKLHTDDDLEDRSDCSLEFLSAKEISIGNRFKYWMCAIGI